MSTPLLCRTPCREAQRATVKLLSSLSRQFRSDELHVAFDEGVALAWEAQHVERDTIGTIPGHHRRGCSFPFVDQRGARGGEFRGRRTRREGDAVGGERELRSVSGMCAWPSNEAAGAVAQDESLSLTRFLSNLVVGCNQVECRFCRGIEGAAAMPCATDFPCRLSR